MAKKIIAVDIDEVLAANAPSFVSYTNKTWGMNLTLDDYHEHWAELWQTDHEETLRRAQEYNFSGAMESMGHFEDAATVLRELSDVYELVIVTARRKELAEITKQWIDHYYGGIFSDIHHAGIWDTEHPDAATYTKAQICNDVGACYLIDDQSKHCNAVQEAGVQAIMFGGYPWNRHDVIVDGVVRCDGWGAVREYFRDQS